MSGLAGMAAVRPVHEPRGLQIAVEPPGLSLTEAQPPHRSEGTPLLIRPALCLTRTDVEQYCRKHSLEFAVDPSNFSSAFTRNRIRQKIVPGLCEIEPNAVRSIARAMELIALDNQVLDGLAKLVLERASQPDEQTHWRHPGYSALEVDVLIGEPQAVVNRAIMLAARRLLPPGNELTSTHVLEVEKLIRMGRSGKHIDLPGGLRVWREGRLIIIDAGRMRRAPYEVELGVGPNGVRAGGFRITLERNKSAAHFDELIVRIRTEKARTGRDWRMAILDDSALPDTLQVRPRRPGERVLVTGQSRSIKLKNLMINHKIPVSRREFWPLAYTRDGRYVWSPGLPPSVDFAANRETRALAFLSATEVERTAELISEEQYG